MCTGVRQFRRSFVLTFCFVRRRGCKPFCNGFRRTRAVRRLQGYYCGGKTYNFAFVSCKQKQILSAVILCSGNWQKIQQKRLGYRSHVVGTPSSNYTFFTQREGSACRVWDLLPCRYQPGCERTPTHGRWGPARRPSPVDISAAAAPIRRCSVWRPALWPHTRCVAAFF